jgi:PKD repeat protein
VKGYACTPEVAGEERSSSAVALFLTPPNAIFIFSSNPRVGVPTVFTDASSPQSTNDLWVFGDGTTDVRQSPAHVFTAPGPYLVYLIASNGAGSSQTAQTVTVAPASASALPAARIIRIDATNPGRRRAHVRIEGRDSVKLMIRPTGNTEAVVFLRFLEASGEAALERRLVVEAGAEGNYDLSAYGLAGEFEIELVGFGQYEPTLTTTGRPHVRETQR